MRTSDVLRWTGVFSCTAVDRGCGGGSEMPIFHDRNMMPVVSEVINVVKAACLVSECIEKDDPGLIDLLEFLGPFRIRLGIPGASDDELVQMAVGPTQSASVDRSRSIPSRP